MSAGHSLGEYCALTCAGTLDFVNALKLVKVRAKLMQECNNSMSGGMTAVKGLEEGLLRKICFDIRGDKVLDIACYNSPKQMVVSGNLDLMDTLAKEAAKYGGKTVMLQVIGAFHSKLMAQAGNLFSDELRKVEFKDFEYDVISSITDEVYKSKDEIRKNLVEQFLKPVKWCNVINNIKEYNVDSYIEMNLSRVMRKLIKENLNQRNVLSFSDESELEKIKNYILTKV
nr:ACP S-malonyltransferase [Clostridium sp. DSM 8431]